MADTIDPEDVQQLNDLAALKHANTPGVTILALAFAEEVPNHGWGEGEK